MTSSSGATSQHSARRWRTRCMSSPASKRSRSFRTSKASSLGKPGTRSSPRSLTNRAFSYRCLVRSSSTASLQRFDCVQPANHSCQLLHDCLVARLLRISKNEANRKFLFRAAFKVGAKKRVGWPHPNGYSRHLRQKSLNRVGDSSVYLTVCCMLR